MVLFKIFSRFYEFFILGVLAATTKRGYNMIVSKYIQHIIIFNNIALTRKLSI